MSSSYPVSFSFRLLLVVLGLVALVGSALYLLPVSSLRYVGIYYAVVGVFNLFILPMFYLLSHSRLQLIPLEVTEIATPFSAAWSSERR